METPHHNIKAATVVLDPKAQKLETVQRLVAEILGRAGCPACGRLAFLHAQFAVDPEPNLGVISMNTIVA